MRAVVTKAPNLGDCFYHVVAHFLGGDINDIGQAREVRTAVSTYLARELFGGQFADLAFLTQYVLAGQNLGAIPLNGTLNAQDLMLRFGNRNNQGNGFGCPIAAFVVWQQYTVDDCVREQKLYKGPQVAGNFLQYVIWGDDFIGHVVEQVWGKPCRFYREEDLDDVEEAEEGVINFLGNNVHFDAVEFEDDEGSDIVEDDSDDEDDDAPPPHRDNLRLEIHHIDVGQGDCTLILFRDGKGVVYSCLIDAGDSGQAPLVDAYLGEAGVKKLDAIIVTHYDRDHFRGVLQLLAYSKICQQAAIFDRGQGETETETKFRAIFSGTEASGGQQTVLVDSRIATDEIDELQMMMEEYARVGSGQRLTKKLAANGLVGKELFSITNGSDEKVAELICVAANGHVLGGAYVEPLHKDRENGRSLNLVLRFGDFFYYFGGDSPGISGHDLEGAVGKAMMSRGVPHCCGFKASHHGSDDSTKGPFVERIKPTCAFITCGEQAKFSHPRQGPLDVLQNAETIQNYYLSRCVYQRQHITPLGTVQSGRARVAGDFARTGTIVLRIDESMAYMHVFHVGYWDLEKDTWRVTRHVCGSPDLCEEIGEVVGEPEDLAITACRTDGAKYIEQTVLLADAIERERALVDAQIVDKLRVTGRNAVRNMLTGEEAKPKPEEKTIMTVEMVEALDEKTNKEIEEMENHQYEDDSDYEFE